MQVLGMKHRKLKARRIPLALASSTKPRPSSRNPPRCRRRLMQIKIFLYPPCQFAPCVELPGVHFPTPGAIVREPMLSLLRKGHLAMHPFPGSPRTQTPRERLRSNPGQIHSFTSLLDQGSHQKSLQVISGAQHSKFRRSSLTPIVSLGDGRNKPSDRTVMFRNGYLGSTTHTFEKFGKFVLCLKGTHRRVGGFHNKQAR
jgi:hypothetical protein